MCSHIKRGNTALKTINILDDNVETLVVREREIAVALSLLEVAILRAAILHVRTGDVQLYGRNLIQLVDARRTL